jgi:autotransporter-associated beta strand protein
VTISCPSLPAQNLGYQMEVDAAVTDQFGITSYYVDLFDIVVTNNLTAPVVTIGAVSSTQIRLNWTPGGGSEQPTGYEVYEKLGGLLTTTQNTTYVASNLDQDTPYTFTVKALYPDGTATSEPVTGRTTPAAASLSWTGQGDNHNWSDGRNWSPGRAPINGDSLTFPDNTIMSVPNNDLSGLSIKSLTFTGGNNYINGNLFTVTQAIHQNSTATDVAITNVQLSGNVTVDVPAAAGTLTMRYLIGSGSLTIQGPGATILGNSDPGGYTGNYVLDGGHLEVTNYNVQKLLGTGTLTIKSGTIDEGSDPFGEVIISNPIVVQGNVKLVSATHGDLKFTGDVTLEKMFTFTVIGYAILDGTVSGPGGIKLVKGNPDESVPGSLELTNLNTYKAGTNLASGVLVIDQGDAGIASSIGTGFLRFDGGALKLSDRFSTLFNTLRNQILIRSGSASITCDNPAQKLTINSEIYVTTDATLHVNIPLTTTDIIQVASHVFFHLNADDPTVLKGTIFGTMFLEGGGAETLAAKLAPGSDVIVAKGSYVYVNKSLRGTGELSVSDGTLVNQSGDLANYAGTITLRPGGTIQAAFGLGTGILRLVGGRLLSQSTNLGLVNNVEINGNVTFGGNLRFQHQVNVATAVRAKLDGRLSFSTVIGSHITFSGEGSVSVPASSKGHVFVTVGVTKYVRNG